MAGSVIIQGQLNSVPQGYTNIGPYSIPNVTANNYSQRMDTLASGANTIAVPSWAGTMIIVPNPSNIIALTFKGVAGDTGVAMSPDQPWIVSFAASPPASIVINAASTLGTLTTFIFF